jgi:hypothetical protein
MGMVAPPQRIASAFVVVFGAYGDVTRQALGRGVSRQSIYRESSQTLAVLEGADRRTEVAGLQEQLRQLQARVADLEEDAAQAVVLTSDLVAHFAAEGEARGVSLSAIHALLEVLQPGQTPSVPTLGRRTKEAAEKAAMLLPILDEFARAAVRQTAADEIYVKAPVLMMVEPESFCWLTGQLTDQVSGVAWERQFEVFPSLEQVTRDAGAGLAKGVANVNAARQEQGLSAVADQLDHFHTLREGGRALRQVQARAERAFHKAEEFQHDIDRKRRQGQTVSGFATHAQNLWDQAEQALDQWQNHERAWDETQAALRLFTPAGTLNGRQQAEAVLAETIPVLSDKAFAKTKRMLGQPQTLTYLDEVERKLEKLPAPPELREVAVQVEGLRRHPELLKGNSPSAATLRALLLTCSVILAKAEQQGQKTLKAVHAIFRNTWRASSLVEGINSVLRMHQARHRKITQGLLDLKRLHWNCHTFHAGRRKGQSPYQRLGLAIPEDLTWWDLLKLTPEQLRDKLSAAKTAE